MASHPFRTRPLHTYNHADPLASFAAYSSHTHMRAHTHTPTPAHTRWCTGHGKGSTRAGRPRVAHAPRDPTTDPTPVLLHKAHAGKWCRVARMEEWEGFAAIAGTRKRGSDSDSQTAQRLPLDPASMRPETGPTCSAPDSQSPFLRHEGGGTRGEPHMRHTGPAQRRRTKGQIARPDGNERG